MDNFSFRLASLMDLQAVSSINLRAYEPAYVPLLGSLPRPAIEDYEPWIRGNLVWVCEFKNIPVGILVFEQHTDFWMIWSLAVDPDYQGRGIAGCMIEQAKKVACSGGVHCLRLHTNALMKKT